MLLNQNVFFKCFQESERREVYGQKREMIMLNMKLPGEAPLCACVIDTRTGRFAS